MITHFLRDVQDHCEVQYDPALLALLGILAEAQRLLSLLRALAHELVVTTAGRRLAGTILL